VPTVKTPVCKYICTQIGGINTPPHTHTRARGLSANIHSLKVRINQIFPIRNDADWRPLRAWCENRFTIRRLIAKLYQFYDPACGNELTFSKIDSCLNISDMYILFGKLPWKLFNENKGLWNKRLFLLVFYSAYFKHFYYEMSNFMRKCSTLFFLGLEVLTAAVIDVAIFWDIAPRSLYVNRCFGGMYHLHLQCLESTEQDPSIQQLARQNSSLSNAGPRRTIWLYTAEDGKIQQPFSFIFI
jgi:hypothetical protein